MNFSANNWSARVFVRVMAGGTGLTFVVVLLFLAVVVVVFVALDRSL